MNDEETKPLVIRITVKYDDGTVREASGPDAAKIMDWWQGIEGLAFVHGMRYEGPCLQEVRKKNKH